MNLKPKTNMKLNEPKPAGRHERRKFFVVTFTSDERTRWLESDERVRQVLAILARSLTAFATAGAEPSIEVYNPKTKGK